MRKLFKKSMPLLMAGLLFFESIIPAFATVTDEHVITSNETVQTEVTYNQESKFEVTVPKLIVIGSDKLTNYTVSVSGDISSDDVVSVVPEESFLMKDISGGENPKADITATVEQDKTEWIFNEFDIKGNGEVSAPDLTSGKWQGTFFFNISMDKEIYNPLVLSIDGLETDSASLGAGDEIQIEATIDGEDATDLVEWESDSSNITVNNGLIETTAAAQVGDTATITATFEIPTTFTLREEAKVYTASLSVTIIDIIFNEVNGNEVISSISIMPGDSKQIEATIIPGSVNGNVTWATTAIAGITLIPNGNKVTVKIASDMPLEQTHYILATCGSLGKIIRVDIGEHHVCSYEKTIVTEATCTTDGLIVFKCKHCDLSYEENIKAIGHNYSDWTTTQNSTCTTTGSQSRTCEVCGKTDTKDIAVLGHNYTNSVTNPTCTAQGYTTHTCSNCGDFYKDTYVAATGHTEEVIKGYGATCTETGLTDGTKCSVCKVTLTAQSVIPATGHTYSNWTTSLNPTCTVIGSQNRTCSVCKEVESKELAAYGHNWESDFTIDKAATCTTDGSKSIHCTRCTTTKDVTVIPATGHTSVNGGTQAVHTKCSVCGVTLSSTHSYTSSVTTTATCTTAGVRTYTCGCGYSYTEAIAATGHTSVNGGTSGVHTKCSTCGVTLNSTHSYTNKVTTAATCTTDGIRAYTCGCGYSYTEVINKLGHTYGNWTTSLNPTCTVVGSQNRTCSVCKNVEKKDIAALGHSWDTTFTIDKAATCTTDGSKSIHCLNCTATKDVTTIPATGHTSANGATQAVHTKCSVCGATLSSTHSYTNKVTTAATCTTAGVRTYTCGCGYKYTESIPATGHSYGTVTYTWSGTSSCTAKRTCSKCNNVQSENATITNAVTKAATCTATGTRTYTAKFTNTAFATQTKTASIAATGHDVSNTICKNCNKIIAGLYDENNNLLCLWENSNIDVTMDYTESNYKTETTSPYYVLTKNYTKTRNIILPENISKIGDYAFYYCPNLLNITIPSNVKTIGFYSFMNTQWLTNKQKENPLVIVNKILIDGSTSSGYVTLPAGITSISDGAFYSCKTLTGINMSANDIAETGKYAFYGCTNLTDVILPITLKTISSNTFNGCINLKNIRFYNDIITIENSAFYNCRSLINMSLPNSITTIQFEAFTYCVSLKDITLPNNIDAIGSYMFKECSSLQTITIPNNVTTIGAYAFQHCTSLQNIIIPEKVTAIRQGVFQGCDKLTSVKFMDLETWYIGNEVGTTTTKIDVTNTSTNATYLKSTYYSKYWTKK